MGAGGSAGTVGATAAQLWPKVYLYKGLGVPRPAAGSVQINRAMYSCAQGATRAAREGWGQRGVGRRGAAGPPWGGRAVEAPGGGGGQGAAARGPAERPDGPGRRGTRRGSSRRALRRDGHEHRAGPFGWGAGWGPHLGPRARPAPPSETARSSPGCPLSPAWSSGSSVGGGGGHRAPGRGSGEVGWTGRTEGGQGWGIGMRRREGRAGMGRRERVRRGQSDVRSRGRGAGGAGPGRGTHVLADERQDERFELVEALVDAGAAAFLQEGLEGLRGEEAVRAARHRRKRFSCRPELTLRSSAGRRGGCGTAPGGDIALRRSGTANAFMSRRAAPPPGPVREAERGQRGREAGRAGGQVGRAGRAGEGAGRAGGGRRVARPRRCPPCWSRRRCPRC